jgi:hypothetical protein
VTPISTDLDRTFTDDRDQENLEIHIRERIEGSWAVGDHLPTYSDGRMNQIAPGRKSGCTQNYQDRSKTLPIRLAS